MEKPLSKTDTLGRGLTRSVLFFVTGIHLVTGFPFTANPFEYVVIAFGLSAIATCFLSERVLLAINFAVIAFLFSIIPDLFIPHFVNGQPLLQVAANGSVWPFSVQSLMLGSLFLWLRRQRLGLAGRINDPLQFVCGTLLIGLSLVLFVESGLVASGIEKGEGLGAIARHAFGASTPIHSIILILWLGLMANVILLYFSIVPAAIGAQRRNRLIRDARLIESLSRLLPMLGFLGTVLGLAAAISSLSVASSSAGQLGETALIGLFSNLAVKFETSFLGLLASISMTFMLATVEARWRIVTNPVSKTSFRE